MTTFVDLVAEAYGAEEAARRLSVVDARASINNVAELGVELLTLFPPRPGACALMSGAWTRMVRDRLNLPAYCVAGDLFVKGRTVFRIVGNSRADFSRQFEGKNLSWDGHCWMVFGHLVCDVSVFRTAYSTDAPPALTNFVLEAYGPGRGLLIEPADALASATGLAYGAKYIATDAQVDGLVLGARAVIRGELDRPDG